MATLSWKNMQSSRPRSAVRALSASSRKSRSVSQIASGWRQPVGWHPGTLKKAPKRNCRLAAVIWPPPLELVKQYAESVPLTAAFCHPGWLAGLARLLLNPEHGTDAFSPGARLPFVAHLACRYKQVRDEGR